MFLSSEVGVLPRVHDRDVAIKSRLEPGRMFLIDFDKARETGHPADALLHDVELKRELASMRPYREFVDNGATTLEQWAASSPSVSSSAPATASGRDGFNTALNRELNTFGLTTETMDYLLTPMALPGGKAKEGLGSMGNDAPLAVLSRLPKRVSEYFKQLFAQVTNPAIDPIREEMVMSLRCPVGPEGNLLEVGAVSRRGLSNRDQDEAEEHGEE